MAKQKRLAIKAEELRILRRRSKNKCECCGLDITVDKHHIIEFANKGPDTASNLLCVCPSCHRAVPKLLSQEDQKFIQTLNYEKQFASFSFYSKESDFQIGSNTYRKCKYILQIDGKSIIYPYEINDRFYVNIVMLKDFDPHLLVIANKVIHKSEEDICCSSMKDSIKILNKDELILEIERSDTKIKVTTNFRCKNKPFIFNDEGSVFPGNIFITGCTFDVIDRGAAISFNFPSPS